MYNKAEARLLDRIERKPRINVSARVMERADAVIAVIAQTEDPVKKTELWAMVQGMVPPRVFISLRMKAFVSTGTTE